MWINSWLHEQAPDLDDESQSVQKSSDCTVTLGEFLNSYYMNILLRLHWKISFQKTSNLQMVMVSYGYNMCGTWCKSLPWSCHPVITHPHSWKNQVFFQGWICINSGSSHLILFFSLEDWNLPLSDLSLWMCKYLQTMTKSYTHFSHRWPLSWLLCFLDIYWSVHAWLNFYHLSQCQVCKV